MKFWHYFLHVATHKLYVLQYSVRFRCIWRGIWHDWSKFTPTEFAAHADYFFGRSVEIDGEGWISNVRLHELGWERATARASLDRAWLHHLRRNPHHPEFWVIVQAGEGDKAEHVRTREFRYVVIEMEEPYRREMMSDWMARALHRDGNNLKDWYETVGRHHPFGPETRAWVEEKLKELEGD